MNAIQIKPELLRVLNMLEGEAFTVADLTQHYLSHDDCLHRDKKPARQFIYRNMVRLMKANLMEKLPDDGGWPKYKLTYHFKHPNKNSTDIESRNKKTTKPKTKPSYKQQTLASKPIEVLTERLNKHRSDMLCALGETEEYEALCKALPEFSEDARELYADARERSALLLGKIKALESLLASHASR